MNNAPDFSDIPVLNRDPEWYNIIEAALCIWEHVIEAAAAHEAAHEDTLYKWMTRGQGVYMGREMAAQLARYVEIAYRVGNQEGGEYMLDGVAYDWQIVPYVIETWAEQFDSPNDITEADAIAIGKTLPTALKRGEE